MQTEYLPCGRYKAHDKDVSTWCWGSHLSEDLRREGSFRSTQTTWAEAHQAKRSSIKQANSTWAQRGTMDECKL